MASEKFSDMEIDAIGEIMNISLGASATAVSNLLGAKTNITTPVVKVQSKRNFQFQDLEPAIGVAISYTEGLDGRNVMLFSRNDVRIIVGMMMRMEIPEDQFELDEMNKSAICEVMNQMMGSSATALSEFLGITVNISTPDCFEIQDEKQFKKEYFPGNDDYIVVRFRLEIGDKINSEFMNIMTADLAKKMIGPFRASMGIPDGNQEDSDSSVVAETSDEPQETPENAPERTVTLGADAPNTTNLSEEEIADKVNEVTSTGSAKLSQAETDALLAKAQNMTAGNRPMTQEEMDQILERTRAEMAAASAAQPGAGESPAGGTSAAQPGAGESQAAEGTPAAETAQASAEAAGSGSADAAAAPGPSAPGSQAAGVEQTTASQTAGAEQTAAPGAAASQPAPQAAAPQYAPAAAPAGPGPMDAMMMQLLNSMQQSQAQMLELIRDMKSEPPKPAEAPKAKSGDTTVVRSMNSQTLEDGTNSEEELPENREMLMKVPLELSVEIGRTKKPVKEILGLTQGSLVVLDKMAGEQADLYVNGECVAKGDIVVVEDNFGIRITEIVNRDIYQEKLSQ